MTLPTCSSAEIRTLIEKHLAQRPDHLICLHPQAPPHLRKLFTDWRERKEHLETQLQIADAAERNRWRDVATGQVIQPEAWSGISDVHGIQNAHQRKKANAALKREQTASATGRLPLASPSRETLQRREQRARKTAREEVA